MGESVFEAGWASHPTLTVVIPALNAEATIEAQLRALDGQLDAPEFSVVVVDNGSTDATAEIAGHFSARTFELSVVSEIQRGINRARNAGIAAAREGFVLLCDSDDVVHNRWVSEMVAAIEPGAWLAGALDYTTLNSAATRRAWGAGPTSTFRPSAPYVDNTYGCNCGFWTSMWQELGGFDPALSGIGGDENEFFMRAHGAGYRVKSVPTAVVAYRLRPGLRAVCRQRYRQGRSQVCLRTTAGGRLLPPAPSIAASARSLVRLIVVSPRHLTLGVTRSRWLATCALHLGRISGQVGLRRQRS